MNSTSRPPANLPTTDHARALWIESPGVVAIRDEPLPVAGTHDVTVTALFSAISRGTESLVFAGAVPASEHARMRAPFQGGDFPAPVKYGYASVGRVEGQGTGSGRLVFCLYPHQSRYVVPVSAVRDVPADVPAQRAVLGANMETAVNALWDAPVSIGDRVVVVGAGVVGCLVGYLAARIAGTRVLLADVEPSRRSVAVALGCEFALPGDASHDFNDADVVFHASASSAGLALALSLCRFEGEVVELSWYGSRPVEVPLGAAFHSRRLTLRASQVGSIAPAKRAAHDYASRLSLALSLLSDPALDVLVSEEVAFNALPSRMADICAGSNHPLAVRVRY